MNTPSSIILYGPAGDQKSTTAIELAKLLKVPHYDTNKLIKKYYGSIDKLIRSRGESYFREIESRTILMLCDIMEGRRIVASLGEGSLARRENLGFICQCGTRIFALSSKLDLGTRIQEGSNHHNEFQDLIEIDGKTTPQIAQEIQEKLKKPTLCLL